MPRPISTKVYVVNKGGHNYSDATRFGELIFMSEGSQNRFAVSATYRLFVESMQGSNEDDYILVTSMNVLNAVASAIFARKHGRLNLLLFNKGQYEPRELDIDSLLYMDDESSRQNLTVSNKDNQDEQTSPIRQLPPTGPSKV